MVVMLNQNVLGWIMAPANTLLKCILPIDIIHAMNTTNFDLNLLRVFDAMMVERNVTRAAQRLFLSQPATSHALERLRKGIGDPLFVRSGREMMPTTKAIALETTVRSMLEQLGLVLEETHFDPLTSNATVRIGCVDAVEYMLVPMFARLLDHEAPHIRFSIRGFDAANFQAQLASGLLDMATSVLEVSAPGMHTRKITEQSLVGLVRKEHPLARIGRATARQLNNVPRLATSLQPDRSEGIYDRLLATAGITGDAAYTTAHFFAAPSLLAKSDLMLIAGSHIGRLLSAQFPLATIQLPTAIPKLQSHLVWHERTHRDPAQKWIRDRIVESARALNP
jgi:DNA-binding transcriptional LysR family regulator